MSIKIRDLKREDIKSCINLFQKTVHSVNADDYSPEQLEVWAPKAIDPESDQWQSLLQNFSRVAELDNEIVGFIDMTKSGYLDRLYVHKDHQGKGIASRLLNKIEQLAKQQSISEITTEASITAKRFFESRGYQVVNEQQKEFKGMKFTNFLMKKKII